METKEYERFNLSSQQLENMGKFVDKYAIEDIESNSVVSNGIKHFISPSSYNALATLLSCKKNNPHLEFDCYKRSYFYGEDWRSNDYGRFYKDGLYIDQDGSCAFGIGELLSGGNYYSKFQVYRAQDGHKIYREKGAIESLTLEGICAYLAKVRSTTLLECGEDIVKAVDDAFIFECKEKNFDTELFEQYSAIRTIARVLVNEAKEDLNKEQNYNAKNMLNVDATNQPMEVSSKDQSNNSEVDIGKPVEPIKEKNENRDKLDEQSISPNNNLNETDSKNIAKVTDEPFSEEKSVDKRVLRIVQNAALNAAIDKEEQDDEISSEAIFDMGLKMEQELRENSNQSSLSIVQNRAIEDAIAAEEKGDLELAEKLFEIGLKMENQINGTEEFTFEQ